MLNKIKLEKKYLLELILVTIFLIFSAWLMFSSFSYTNGFMMIGSKAWSDFSSTIPVIRSFSLGFNFPPEYPLFSGEPIHYHFLFYLLVGFLERIGIRIDYALNIPSFLGFAGLLTMIYFFAKKIFKNTFVGLLSVLFFVFNGSLAFLEFFKIHPISSETIKEIFLNNNFPSFGPYDGKIISAFWNLNIYTNQRHLAMAFTLSLLIIFIFLNSIFSKKGLKIKSSVLIGLVLGLFFFFHLAIFLITVIVLLSLAILFKETRAQILVALFVGIMISIPQYLFLQSGSQAFSPLISFGYLVQKPVKILSFLQYWFLNLGLHSILIPIGFILANSKVKKIFLAFFLIFIVGNTIQFSPEIAANHKFFNYFMIIGTMFSAFALIKIWKIHNYSKPFVIILFFFLIFSGVIDLFPIYNDVKVALEDYKINPDIAWIKDNTPPNSIFLNTQYLYDPASLAGRKIFLGWPYFAWSAGYDTRARDNLRRKLLNSTDFNLLCKESKNNGIDYVEINTATEYDYPINHIFFEKNLKKNYQSSQYEIFNTKNC